jgi:hypothetical protein
MDSKNASLLQTVLVLGAAYFVYKKFSVAGTVLQTSGESVGAAIADIFLPHINVTSPDYFRVIAGTVAHIYTNPDGTKALRLWDWSSGGYKDAPGLHPPTGWENAPVPVAHFADVRAAGKPWFTPWDSSGFGLNAAFSSTASGTVTGWFDNLFK